MNQIERKKSEKQDLPLSATRPQREAAQLLRLNKSDIIDAWEKRVRRQVPSAKGQTSLSITHTLGIFLDELCLVLEQDDPSYGGSTQYGMSGTHGGQRATFTGYFLPQLLKEFSVLRELINEILHGKSLLTYEVRSLIDRSIDEVVSLAATEFTAVHSEETKTALQKAETSNRALEHFASIAAHDLKSPLATISSYLAVLSDDFQERLGDEGTRFVGQMITLAQRMRRLIDQLLDYAHVTSVNKPFQLTDMAGVVNAAIQNLSSSIASTKTKVSYSRLPIIMGDADLLTRLFQNLIANAIKFHGEASPVIQIEAQERDKEWVFSVQDNGIGFDPAQGEEIFALYKKLHGESVYQGSGIGLATCRKIVELHGGRIWAESKLESGSTFYFTLPKHNAERDSLH